jgi:hypothetical protein
MVPVIGLQPHLVQRVQPLVVAFIKTLKTIEMWLKAHQGRVITHCPVATLLAKAYARDVTIGVAVVEFRNTGIFPIHPNDFRGHCLASNAEDVDFSVRVKEQHSTSLVMPCDISLQFQEQHSE